VWDIWAARARIRREWPADSQLLREFVLLRRAFEGVGEVASGYYGQFPENPRTIPLARFSFPPCTEFAWFRIVRESSAIGG